MYGKLFASLYQGTLRGRAHEILVFTNLIAHCDQFGIVDKHWRAIAEEVGLSIDEVKKAVLALEAPDPESRSPEEGGARIVRMDDHREWGWRVVNYAKYRAIRSAEDRRHQNAAAKRRQRGKPSCETAVLTVSTHADSPKCQPRSATVSHGQPRSAQAEAEAEAEAEANKPLRHERSRNIGTKPPPSETLARIAKLHSWYCQATGRNIPQSAAERTWFEWMRGKWTDADLETVVRYLDREIQRDARKPGALRLENMLAPDRFAEDLGQASGRKGPIEPLTKRRPAPQPKPEPQAPQASPEKLREWGDKLKQAVGGLAGKVVQQETENRAVPLDADGKPIQEDQ